MANQEDEQPVRLQKTWSTHFEKPDVGLECSHASFTVKARDGGKKRILDDVSLTARGGEMQALMGPSGAGKTTLLDFMALELKGGEVEGSLTLNGTPLTFDLFQEQAAYVEQFDTHWAFLTTREIMQFSAELYLPGNRDQQKERVEHMMEVMGLQECANTKAGNAFFKGLSGGQCKRLTAAVAMLKAPALLLLDEPTTGLDAASTEQVLSYLKRLAQKAKIVVIATIHQPSTEVFLSFDKATFLANGRISYSGLTKGVADYCEELGYPLPPFTNPADHVLTLTNSDFVGREEVDAFVNSWHTRRPAEVPLTGLLTLPRRPTKASWKKSLVVFRRQALMSFRDPTLYTGRMIAFLFINLFFAFIYMSEWQMTQHTALSRINLLGWFFCLPSSMAVLVVHATAEDYKLVKKEIKNGMMSASSYLWANFILQVPFMPIMSIFALGAAMGAGGFGYDHIGEQVLILSVMMLTFESCAQFLGVSFKNSLMGMVSMSAIWFACYLFMGASLPEKDVPWPFRIFCTILPLKWTFQSVLYVTIIDTTWKGAELVPKSPLTPLGFRCPGDFRETCVGVTGKQVLSTLSLKVSCITTQNPVVQNFFIVLAIAAVCKLLFVTVFLVKTLNIGAARMTPPKTLGGLQPVVEEREEEDGARQPVDV